MSEQQEHWPSTWSTSWNERLVRATDDDPPYRVVEVIYRCEREAGHGGDHHGPAADLGSDATWPA